MKLELILGAVVVVTMIIIAAVLPVYGQGLELLQVLQKPEEGLNTTATSECRPPVEMTNNPRFLVEKCDDGSSHVTDTEDGNKTFVPSGETKRVCTHDDICFELSSP